STGAQVLASKIDADCFSGSGANAIIGLNTAIGATGTYANISRSTYTEWKGNVISNSGVARDLAKWQLDALEAAIFDACGMPPNVIVCSAAAARKYENMFDSQTRVVLNARDLAVGAQANALGNMAIDVGGFTGLSYKGMPVFRARNCQAGRIYMLNTTQMELQTVPFGRRNTSGNVERITLTTGGAQRKDLGGLNVAIEALAKTGDADKYTVKLYPQLKVIRPNANGWLDDVNEVG
ncbi:MAG: phage major capsid protein, partial [Pseudolysinimonas sp.]